MTQEEKVLYKKLKYIIFIFDFDICRKEESKAERLPQPKTLFEIKVMNDLRHLKHLSIDLQ